MIDRINFIFAACCMLALLVLLSVIHWTDRPTPCTTDSECLLLCEPADLDCDGGPQSAK
jgi:hypothetical protein